VLRLIDRQLSGRRGEANMLQSHIAGVLSNDPCDNRSKSNRIGVDQSLRCRQCFVSK
jgi:hypothetical protein